MRSQMIFVLGALASLTSAIPTPVENVARCGTTIYPSLMQSFSEAAPDSVFSNSVVAPASGKFSVSQASGPSNRFLQGVTFSNIPAGSYGCQLSFTFPAGSTINETPNAVMNVTTLAKGHSGALVPGNTLTYNQLFTQHTQDIGLFGTVGPFQPGQTVVVNSESCPTDVNGGGNLSFLFSIASWINGPASLSFDETSLQGVYLTYNC